MRFKTLLFFAGVLVLLTVFNACNPARRASKLVKRAERICPECEFTDTVIVRGRDVDFLYPISLREPTVLERNGVTLTVYPPAALPTNPNMVMPPEVLLDSENLIAQPNAMSFGRGLGSDSISQSWGFNVRTETDTMFVERFAPCPCECEEKTFWDKAEDFGLKAGALLFLLILVIVILRTVIDKALSK